MPGELNQTQPPSGRWSRALEGEKDALRELCVAFAYPVYVWERAVWDKSEDAAGRTESFFSWLIKEEPPSVDEMGSECWRDFLSARLERFMAEGFPDPGGSSEVTIDRALFERRFAKEPAKPVEMLFARRWALTVLEATIESLRREYTAEGKAALVQHLQPFLAFSMGGEARYVEVARQIGKSLSSLRVEVFRFRQRYRETLRLLVADTVRDEANVDSELTGLLCAVT